MTSIAVAQDTCRQVEHTYEEGDKEAVLFVLRSSFIDGTDDAMGLRLSGRDVAEKRACDGHHKRAWHTLTCHIADTEEEFLVTDIEIVKVASHFLGRHQCGKDIYIGTIGEGRKLLRQQTHLNGTGNLQLAFDGALLLLGSYQAAGIADGEPENEAHEGKTCQHHDYQPGSQSTKRTEDLAVEAYDGHRPSSIFV